MNKKKILIGSRESKLAVVQSEEVKNYINNNSSVQADLLTMKTTGDKILDKTLDKIGGKGLFVKELDRALIEEETELSVHSLKDMPMEIPEQLPLVAFSKREDPRDVLVLPKGAEELDPSKPIGCSSLRRIIQLKELYPNMEFKPVRGNVITRLEKLDRGEYSALALAAAGLIRLGLQERITEFFDPEDVLPAAGQAILAVQGRKGVDYSYLEGYGDREAQICATAERAYVKYLDGGCSSPVAAFAELRGEELFVRGLYYCSDGSFIKGSITGSADQAHELGVQLAERLKSKEK